MLISDLFDFILISYYIGTNVTLSSLTQGYTEVPKVVALLHNMTDLLEVLLNTVTQDPGKVRCSLLLITYMKA